MRTLSLLQPWASLLISGAKKWETRSWKPSTAMQHILRTEGFLIHSSAKFDAATQRLLTFPPFMQFFSDPDKLPVGHILGHVKLGRVISTFDWKQEFDPVLSIPAQTEFAFGNYGANRWAWEITSVFPYEEVIAAKGSLSLWNYEGWLPDPCRLVETAFLTPQQ